MLDAILAFGKFRNDDNRPGVIGLLVDSALNRSLPERSMADARVNQILALDVRHVFHAAVGLQLPLNPRAVNGADLVERAELRQTGNERCGGGAVAFGQSVW